jgi:hypothetical protein
VALMVEGPQPSQNPTHYDLLSEHHRNAAKAAGDLRAALEQKIEAEDKIRDARKRLVSSQALIRRWYSEPNPEPGLDPNM